MPPKVKPPARAKSFYNAADALKKGPQRVWFVEKVVPQSGLGILFGEPGCGKSYAVLDLLVCVAMGKPWLGQATTKATTLFVDTEMGSDTTHERCGAVLRGHGGDVQTPFLWAVRLDLNLRTSEGVQSLKGLIEESQAKLIALDCLANCTPGADENTSRDILPVLKQTKIIAERTRTDILFVHHAGKNGNYRGSSSIKGAVDYMLELEAAKDGHVSISFEKARHVKEFAFGGHMNFKEDSFHLSTTTAIAAAEHFSQTESLVLELLASKDRTLEEIESNARAKGCSPKGARQAVYALVRKAKVARRNPGTRGVPAVYGIVKSEVKIEPKGVFDLHKLKRKQS